MPVKTTLNAKNLERLGAERLAQLLMEIATGDAAAKRRLRVALAGARGPAEAGREIAKRLTSIARARRTVSWRTRKAVVDDLEAQRRAILEEVAPAAPDEALALIWQFLALAPSVMDRTEDRSGAVLTVFSLAGRDLAAVAAAARPDPAGLARTVFDALRRDDVGLHDGLIARLAPVLGADGLARLKALVEDLGRERTPVPPKEERIVVGWGMQGPIYKDELLERIRMGLVRSALMDIADAEGDVDGFIAQIEPAARATPQRAADIARRLLAAGRAAEALAAVEAVDVAKAHGGTGDWEEMRLAALEATGRMAEAQDFRWRSFERTLSVDHLRAFLKRLPDFDDVEAEERAMAFAAASPNLFSALDFFLAWPALDRAAALLIDRRTEIDGDHYERLAPAAEALAERHPLAATMALRAMIDFTLTRARSKRYVYAADHLATCARLAPAIDAFGPIEPHDRYVARLRAEHGRKYGFWSATGIKD